MKKLGLILGGIYLVNGVIDLLGGEHAMKWMHSTMAKRLPAPVGNSLRKMTELNPTALRTIGVLNLLGGIGMVLASATAGMEAPRRRRLFHKLGDVVTWR